MTGRKQTMEINFNIIFMGGSSFRVSREGLADPDSTPYWVQVGFENYWCRPVFSNLQPVNTMLEKENLKIAFPLIALILKLCLVCGDRQLS